MTVKGHVRDQKARRIFGLHGTTEAAMLLRPEKRARGGVGVGRRM